MENDELHQLVFRTLSKTDQVLGRRLRQQQVINRQLKVTIGFLIIALVVALSGIMILLAKLAEVT